MEQMAINGLPQDIIVNILKRLPVRDILRFRCVCKHWRNLFKTPSFIQHHLHHSTHHNSSLLVAPVFENHDFFLISLNQELQFRELDIPPFIHRLENNPFVHGFYLVVSSNGLICFEDRSAYPHQAATPVLWNPATGEVRRVPIISDPFPGKVWVFGFGFSPISNDYRIVRVGLSTDGLKVNVSKVEVYSLRSGCWRNIEFDKIKALYVNYSVTANGVMFWHGKRGVVVSFDLATEEFTVISWPPFVGYFCKLAVFDDKLAIISNPKIEKGEHGFSSLYFAVMEEGDIDIGSSREKWSSSKKYIGKSELLLHVETTWRNQIVAIDLSVQTVTESSFEVMNHLYLIDVNANDCKQLDIPRLKAGTGFRVFNYVESLVPVCGNIQIEEP